MNWETKLMHAARGLPVHVVNNAATATVPGTNFAGHTSKRRVIQGVIKRCSASDATMMYAQLADLHKRLIDAPRPDKPNKPPPVDTALVARIKPGPYNLTVALTNPSPDRRSDTWHTRPVIKPRPFYVDVRSMDHIWDERSLAQLTPEQRQRILGSREVVVRSPGATYHSVTFILNPDGTLRARDPDDANTLGAALFAAFVDGRLEPDPTLRAALGYLQACEYVHPVDIIEQLIANGDLLEREVYAAVAAVQTKKNTTGED